MRLLNVIDTHKKKENNSAPDGQDFTIFAIFPKDKKVHAYIIIEFEWRKIPTSKDMHYVGRSVLRFLRFYHTSWFQLNILSVFYFPCRFRNVRQKKPVLKSKTPVAYD